MLHDVKKLIGRLFGDRSGQRSAAPPPPTFDEAALFAHLREPAAAAGAVVGFSCPAVGAVAAGFDPSGCAFGSVDPSAS